MSIDRSQLGIDNCDIHCQFPISGGIQSGEAEASKVRSSSSLSGTTADLGKLRFRIRSIELSPELARDGRLLLDCKDTHKSQ